MGNFAQKKSLCHRSDGFFVTGGANPFHHIVDALCNETVRQIHQRDMCGRNAERLFASGAVEMDMPVFQQAVVGIGAGLVFEGTAAVFESMHQMMFLKEVEGAEKRGFVDGFQLGFEFGERSGVLVRQQDFQDKLPDGSRLYSLLFQAFRYLLLQAFRYRGGIFRAVHGIVFKLKKRPCKRGA